MKIHWTDAAKEDVREIRDYLRQHASDAVAKQVIKEIQTEVASLRQWPNKGFPIQALIDLNLTTYRELLTGPNRIIFERTPTAFNIHLVCHTSRDLEALLQRRHIKP